MASNGWRKGLTDVAIAMVEAACKAYKLDPDKEIMAVGVKKDDVTIVTNGAHKVRWKKGADVKPLSDFHAGRPPKKAEVEAP